MNIIVVILLFCTCSLIGLFLLLFVSIKEETINVEKYLNFYKLEIEKQKKLLQKGDLKRNTIEHKIRICKKKLKEKR